MNEENVNRNNLTCMLGSETEIYCLKIKNEISLLFKNSMISKILQCEYHAMIMRNTTVTIL